MFDFSSGKWWNIPVRILLSLYLSFVFVGKTLIEICYRKKAIMSQYGMSYFFVIYLVIFIAAFVGFYFLLVFLSRKGKSLFKVQKQKGKLSAGLFIGVFLPILFVYLIYFYIYYPCSISMDNLHQWAQAHTMQLNDHHPVFHTLLIRLATLVVDSYPFMVFIQIILLAVGIAYLSVTLKAWGLSTPVVLLVSFVLGYGVHTRAIMFFVWKDTTMSLFFLFLLAQMVNIFLSRGEWLKKPLHWISMAILLAMITLVRHNAILFTLPLAVLLILTYSKVRKSSFLACALCLALVLGVKGPLYSALNVTPAEDSYAEVIGIPMTILSSIYSLEPEKMTDESYQFMSTFASQEEFSEKYIFGNYNSVKWQYVTQQKLSQAAPSPVQVLSMTVDAIRADKLLAAVSILELTDFVWEPTMNEVVYTGATKGEALGHCNLTIVPELEMFCYEISDILYNAFSGNVFNALSSQLGVLILVMLLAWYISQKEHGLSGLWLVLPILCYNFGTMLLLCGDDARFFHFNCFAAYPIAILLLSRCAEQATEDAAQ